MGKKVEIEKIYSLSPMQQGMLFHWLLEKEPGTDAYYRQSVFTIKGEIDTGLFEKSIDCLIDRYEVLRTVFVYDKIQKPKQVVLKKVEAAVNFEDIVHLSGDNGEQQQYLESFRQRDILRGFDLTKGLLLRFSLFKTAGDSYTLVWSYHHIIMDGWCLGIIFGDLLRIYRHLRKGEPLDLEPVVPYRDYIKWLENRDMEGGLRYWREYLDGYELQAVLPRLKKGGGHGNYLLEEYEFTIPGDLTAGIMKMTKENRVTVNTLCQTLWGLLLQRYNNTGDVVFGATVSGRPAEIPGIERIVGLFINTIPVRVRVEKGQRVSQLLKLMQQRAVSSQTHEYLPLADIQAESDLKGDLIDHIMVFENYPMDDTLKEPGNEEGPGFSVESFKTRSRTSYDFNILVTHGRCLSITFNFNAAFYETGFIKRAASHLINFFKQAVENPFTQVEDIRVMSEEEKRQLLVDFNDTRAPYPGDKTMHELFEEQVKRTPDAVGIKHRFIESASGNISITYGLLNKKSNQLARLLRAKGVKPGAVVGIMIERSPEMVIGLWGILKAGGAYLPIDPQYPRERRECMLEESAAQLVVTRGSHVEGIDGKYIPIDIKADVLCGWDDRNPEHINIPEDLLYTIFTSGSTGKPKGAGVFHRGFVNLVNWYITEFDIQSCDSTLLITSLSFDLTQKNIFTPLMVGGTLHIPGQDHYDPRLVSQTIGEEKLTWLNCTPGMFYLLLENTGEIRKLASLKYVFLGGEPISVPLSMPWFGSPYCRGEIVNTYGPTECTDVCSYYRVKEPGKFKEEGVPIPIGKPIANTRLFVLDRRLRPQFIGVPGELFIAGAGVGKGYINDRTLTEEKFITLCFDMGKDEAIRSYGTGDLVKWLPDGNIEFLGRIDHQVKVRGFRIELGEIERQLSAHPGVKEAVVLTGESKEDDQRYLCAYIAANSEAAPGYEELKEYVGSKLPDYMVPSYFVFLEKIPLTANGKVDRRSLPAPRIETGENYTAPTGEIEKKLLEIWSEILMAGDALIGIDDNFFDLGGHSLKVTTMVSRIHKELEVKVPVAEVFTRSTVRELAGYVREMKKEVFTAVEAVERKEYYPLSSAQRRLFILNEIEDIETSYNVPLVMEIEGNADKTLFEKDFRALIRRHESLRTSFPLVLDEPVQRIHQAVEFEMEYYDLATGGGGEDFLRTFDLSHAPLLRVRLVRWEKDKYKLLLDMHHIISDGVSTGILAREFVQIYKGEEPGKLRVQYKDFSEWQNRLFASENFKKQEKYWLEDQLSGDLPILEMPLDFKRPPKMTFEGSSVIIAIPGQIVEKINALVNRQNITLNMLFFTVYAILLSKYSGMDEMIIGSLVAGRNHTDLEKVMGIFANFLPVKIRIEKKQSCEEILKSAKTTMLKAYENQDYPFERMVEHLNAHADFSRNPLFDTMLIFHNEWDPMSSGGKINDLTFAVDSIKSNISILDFKLDVYPASAEGRGECSGLCLDLQYNVKLFKKKTMEGFLHHFTSLLGAVADDLGQTPEEIELFTEAEKSALLEKRKQTPFTLAVSATFTAEPINDYTRWWCKTFNLEVEPRFAPYNQVFQQLIDENSLISTNSGVNLIMVRFEDWLRDVEALSSHRCDLVMEKLENHFDQLVRLVKEKEKRIPYFFGLFPLSTHLSISPSAVKHLEEMNRRWKKILEEMENVYVVDFAEVIELYGIEEVFDAVKDREGHLPFSDEYYAAVGTMVARKLVALKKPPYKVIVLDCDNTLWKGICGEDGAKGIRIEGPYKELQQFMLKKLDEGMLLALCSKNNEADVWEVFEKNAQMLLKKEHLVGWKINWNPKPGNLEELAAELNLGIDSFIFVDDSPMECSQMMEQCPEVLTVQLPGEPGEISMFLKHIWAFDRLKVTAEDKKRTRMYITEQKRREVKNSISSLDDFIKSLELKVRMVPMDGATLPRAAQLTQRTNQFNLSTIRRTEIELGELLQIPGFTGWILQVTDRFGDYGQVGVVIAKEERSHLFIDTFLLSCRVLGRRVEQVVLAGLKEHCRGKNITALHAAFFPTKKNKPFLEFLEKTGWEKIDEIGEHVNYILHADKIPGVPAYIDFDFKQDRWLVALNGTTELFSYSESRHGHR